MTGIHMLFATTKAPSVPPGQQAYTTVGSSTFVVPAGVTSISAVAVGSGAYRRSAGGALAYVNNISVTPGESLTVVVSGSGGTTQSSYLARGATKLVQAGSAGYGSGAGYCQNAGPVVVGTGGNGGSSSCNCTYGGGGAGGYSGNGGNGRGSTVGQCGSGGGGGGGGGRAAGYTWGGGGGGGVGLLGAGSSGAGGSYGGTTGGGGGGGGGSSGAAGGTGSRVLYCCNYESVPGKGGTYGGGGGGGSTVLYEPGKGAVRIIWPGNTRSFPSTNTGNL